MNAITFWKFVLWGTTPIAAVVTGVVMFYANLKINEIQSQIEQQEKETTEMYREKSLSNQDAIKEQLKDKTEEEINALKPELILDVNIHHDALPSDYAPPLKEYRINFQNKNKNSATINDFSAHFAFRNKIESIKTDVSVPTGLPATISSFRIDTEDSKGNMIKIYEEKQSNVHLNNTFSFSIDTIFENGKETNSNEAVLYCERWPENAIFEATVVINTKITTNTLKLPVGSFSGRYYYEIDGKKYQETFKKELPLVDYIELQNSKYELTAQYSNENFKTTLKKYFDNSNVVKKAYFLYVNPLHDGNEDKALFVIYKNGEEQKVDHLKSGLENLIYEIVDKEPPTKIFFIPLEEEPKSLTPKKAIYFNNNL